MKKLSCRMLTVSLIAGCLGVGLSACVQQNSEPLVNGKPLSFWLRQYNSTSVSGGEPEKTALNEQAVSAVRSIGTNAIPTLLKLIRTTNSHQQSLRNHYPQPVHLSEANIEGINGFFILGEAASNAVPALVEIFEDQKSPTSQASAAWALDGIGPGATAAIPALLRAATNSESSTHPLAFLVLAEIPASYDEVIPIAAHALSDTNFLVRINAMDVLGSRGSNAKAAVPALVGLSTNSDFRLRLAACVALGKIHALPDVTVPALTACLADPVAQVRGETAWDLGNFGSLAQSAIPALNKLQNDKDPKVCSAAKEALKNIQPKEN